MSKLNVTYSGKTSFIGSIGHIIFYLMVGLIPHIYKYTEFIPSASESVYFKEPVYADLYVLAKSRLFLLLIIVLLGVFIYQIVNKEIYFIKDKILIGTGLAGLIVVVSSVFSQYQDIVYWGAKDRFEGMWIWIAYLVLFTVARHYGTNRQFVERLLKVFVLSASVMAVFGLMQINGYDIYTESVLRWLCFPKEMAADITKYIVINTTQTLAVGALYNSNYFGVYSAVAAIGGLVLFLSGRVSTRVFFGVAVVLNYAAMIASRSEAALLGFAVALFVVFLSNSKEFWNQKLYTIALIIALFVADRKTIDILAGHQSTNARYIYLLMVSMMVLGSMTKIFFAKFELQPNFFKRRAMILSVITIIVVILGFNGAYKYVPVVENSNLIERLSLENNQLLLKMVDDEALKIEFLTTGINAYGEDGRSIIGEPISENLISLKTNNSIYQMYFKQYSNGYLATLKEPIDFNVFYDGETIQYVDKISGIGELQHPKRFDYYANKGNAFTKRGYIWGTYIPIAKNNLLIGSGLDTYSLIFPQNDYVGKHNAYTRNYCDVIVDKPHSTYLMVGLAMGIVGLCCLLLMIAVVLERYYRCLMTPCIMDAQFAILTVLFVAGIFNDSSISIGILMFCFAGNVLSFKQESEGV